MDLQLEISDPTDWHGTPLSAFAPLDAALRCQVCKDFFTTPMMTSCSHTFCALCIRRCLAADGLCPACRANEQEIKLRRNWAMQEVVDSFQAARAPALEVAKQKVVAVDAASSTVRKGSKRKRGEDVEAEDEERAGPRTRGASRRATSSNQTPEVQVVDDDSSDADFVPADGLVACPICSKHMKPEDVFPHLDRCEDEQKEASRPKPAGPLPIPAQSSKADKPPPERLPHLNYSLLKDAALRKRLQELGIPAWGPRALQISRHKEWITLWNANCDSSRPRSKRDLLSELDVWERTQGGHSANGGSFVPSSVMRKDFDGVDWAKKNRGEFDQLIAAARDKRRSGPAKAVVRSSESPETGEQDGGGEDAQHHVGEKISSSSPVPIRADTPQDHASGASTPSEKQIRKIIKTAHRNENLRMLLDGQDDEDDDARQNGIEGSAAAQMIMTANGHDSSTAEVEDGVSGRVDAGHSNSPTSSARRKPMFTVPEDPVVDAEILS